MTKRRILYFTSDQHYLYSSSGSALELEAKFSPDESGVEEFRQYLRGRLRGLFSVVADLTGEDFHEDQIPHLRAGDRQAVVQRRLAQRYRDTRLATAVSLGYVTTPQRRNERLLLASFTNTQQLFPWLEALEQSGARLAGVYSVPLLAPVLAARLGVKKGRCLLVTANRAGLRQSFIEDGRLRFARLERTVEMEPQTLAVFVRSETLRLAQYLSALRALPREGAAVRVLVVAPPGQGGVFQHALGSDAQLQFEVVETEQAVRKAGLRRLPEGAGAEGLYLHLAAAKPPREQFASRDDRRRYVVWQLQRGIMAAGALAFAASAAAAGLRWLDAVDVRQRAAEQVREAQVATQQYERITAAFPVTHTTTENLKAAVVEFQRIAQRTASPEAAFLHVSRVLEKFPQFELDRLQWSLDSGAAAAAKKPIPGAAPPAKAPAGSGDNALRLELGGRVNATQREDYRGLTAQVQRFATALSESGYELVRTQLPFDITPEGTLTGDIGNSTDTGEAPRFTVILSRRLP